MSISTIGVMNCPATTANTGLFTVVKDRYHQFVRVVNLAKDIANNWVLSPIST
jgi:hypothetical protein